MAHVIVQTAGNYSNAVLRHLSVRTTGKHTC